MPLLRAAPLLGFLLLAQAADQKCQSGQDEDLISALQTARRQHSQKSSADEAPAPAPCPYDFTPPLCEVAEVQAPRDLLPGAVGHRFPKAATLTEAQGVFLPLTNVHFHLGAEHRSEEYKNATDSEEYDQPKKSRKGTDSPCSKTSKTQDPDCDTKGPRPGFMCDTAGIAKEQLSPYVFKHCKNAVEVGKTYEIHYVHSSAGYSKRDLHGIAYSSVQDGLGGAANGRGQLNPMIAVQAQVVMLTNGGSDELALKPSRWTPDRRTSVNYPGSTTGTSFNNTVCSPYAITWHVDKRCYRVTAQTFDNFCRELSTRYNISDDLNAHGSRMLVDPSWVANSAFVLPLF